ncbi:hypothetical protein [Culicoidibacter larvae]|uniref:Uncharacterized protein n=1 Tax=Culicoidibacter larvae TaxID=2579976 RepID=A0A5R8Q7G7_9FIRM|nr:hypothetical protein [Culicoidibacter larvae]TLG71071.1 hypothetical protein FEZ08_11710 [Culicoidibacter larvae]
MDEYLFSEVLNCQGESVINQINLLRRQGYSDEVIFVSLESALDQTKCFDVESKTGGEANEVIYTAKDVQICISSSSGCYYINGLNTDQGVAGYIDFCIKINEGKNDEVYNYRLTGL